MKVKFYDEVEDNLLKFAVIISEFQGEFVFCKHKERTTFEIPGGHREIGETILDTAKRELKEETGAEDFQIEPISVYSVCKENQPESYGMLYYAKIASLNELKNEIESIHFFKHIPNNLTYPNIQPYLHDYAMNYLKTRH